MRRIFCNGVVGLFLCIMSVTINAQRPPAPLQPFESRPVSSVWPGTMPGETNPLQHESTMRVPGEGVRIVRNVTVPTLTAFLPQSNPSGTAVIIAPGGGFRLLSIENEGYFVAEWFAQHGVAAFVLKYRLAQTPASDEEFMPSQPAAGAAAAPSGVPPGALAPLPRGVEARAIADGIQAIKDVRANADKWGISADRIVFIGFSAGGVVTTGVMLAANAAERPNFAAPIYGAPFSKMPRIPTNLPPAFLAVAADDPLAAMPVINFFNALHKARNVVELHVFRTGSHGFSMRAMNGTSDHWIDELYWWMHSYGLTRSPGTARTIK
jgi:acetyl esterase/lipase